MVAGKKKKQGFGEPCSSNNYCTAACFVGSREKKETRI
jgi:hypothetical protein